MKKINTYLDELYKLERSIKKYDLKNITSLLRHIGNPHKKFKSIHIAGTNGKGATASYISSILIEHGLKTGLYTSPHIIKFNERIRINKLNISDSYVMKFIDENYEFIKRLKPSFFEVTTAMAFKYFADNKIDVAVVETGMGGRLDSTNVLKSHIAVITQIGLDHKKYLGNTLREIAQEKIGIIKKNSLVVISDSNSSLKKFFRMRISHNKTYFLDNELEYNYDKIILYKNNTTYEYHSPLEGEFQIRNAACAILTCSLFAEKNKIILKKKAVEKGIRKVKSNSGYFGRLEKLKWRDKNFILDVSHNPQAIKATLESLKVKPDLTVFAMMKDKDFRTSVRYLTERTDNIIFTGLSYHRSVSPEKLFSVAKKIILNPDKQIRIISGLHDVKKYISNSEYSNILFIGSFFLVSEVIKTFKLSAKLITRNGKI
ncbi:MAG: bifunctional folylpolyglutamate synthase/dihydrofolate synthase [Ignavibacteria bacterium]|nr:bifunctional folylpolyglutamate synthase/dihydrofolate synthase [Ignavibacteria bacterium]